MSNWIGGEVLNNDLHSYQYCFRFAQQGPKIQIFCWNFNRIQTEIGSCEQTVDVYFLQIFCFL
jgi:hypothetical protein